MPDQGVPPGDGVQRPALHILLDDMKETLLDSGGVGLAAPQVGILRRVCVVMNEDDEIIELVNPEIIATEGEQTGLEGCLSVPGKYGMVTRPDMVRVRAQDRDGNLFEVEDEGLTARCFCHEIEHLDGHLFVEHTDHLLTEEELEEYIRQQEEEATRNEDSVYGHAGFRCGVPEAAGGGRARRSAACSPSRTSRRTAGMKLPFSPVKEYALAQGTAPCISPRKCGTARPWPWCGSCTRS